MDIKVEKSNYIGFFGIFINISICIFFAYHFKANIIESDVYNFIIKFFFFFFLVLIFLLFFFYLSLKIKNKIKSNKIKNKIEFILDNITHIFFTIPLIGNYILLPSIMIFVVMIFFTNPIVMSYLIIRILSIPESYLFGCFYVLSSINIYLFSYKFSDIIKFLIRIFIFEDFKSSKLVIKATQKMFVKDKFIKITYAYFVFVYIFYNFLSFSNTNVPAEILELLEALKEGAVTFIAFETAKTVFPKLNKNI